MNREQNMNEINIERAKAIITLIVTCAVNIVNVYGYTVDVEQWVNVALSLLSAACIVWTWWKNMNLTPQAVEGQKLIDSLKAKHAKAA